jgi:hypothetical protein
MGNRDEGLSSERDGNFGIIYGILAWLARRDTYAEHTRNAYYKRRIWV